jgi:hypothetical protein
MKKTREKVVSKQVTGRVTANAQAGVRGGVVTLLQLGPLQMNE